VIDNWLKAMKQKIKIPTKQTFSRTIAALSVAVVVIASQSGGVYAATLEELRAQNTALQNQINDNNARAKELAAQADTLENQLAELNLQIRTLQDQITLTKGKIAELQASLDKAQAELDRQKALLKASVQALYKKGGASTVELLVGSDSFSQFINDQTYLERLKSGIQDSAQKVIALKQQIQTQQAEQQKLLSQQQAQQESLTATQQQQQSLLDQTKGQEAAYQSMVKSLRSQQQQVLADIASKLAASGTTLLPGDGSNGGYPTAWNNAAQDSVLDSWGMYNRECVSYTAFKVAQSGRNMPYWGGRGNANEWPGNARAMGIPVDRSPQPGDVAITYNGVYGHAMYVEAVSGRMVTVSQYNWPINGQWGRYSMMTLNADTSSLGPMTFIHFP
jgi:surface antigen